MTVILTLNRQTQFARQTLLTKESETSLQFTV
jgi:hypothetical protein